MFQNKHIDMTETLLPYTQAVMIDDVSVLFQRTEFNAKSMSRTESHANTMHKSHYYAISEL